ncbi:sugar O-acetyltransferase [Actinokineospora auranticolor]|uniref:Maltose O-acetyltransferase n=1 Tax=Actinokineospora auranticolor TaxID=155976 RepID=A0A2S6GLE6_9PSEU|nr:sugar O-acetyltransferase [Actinokineospora auranticolor]PPK66049.1 maltose O-acetyltransferase [Actinokineospora auranticolor]
MTDPLDRMRRGDWYLDGPELVAARRRCWHLQNRFNATGPDDDRERRHILEQLLGRIGPDTVVMPGLQISYGTHTRLGANTFINTDVLLMDDAPITIGDDVRIGPRTQLTTALHPVDDHQRRREGWEQAKPVSIGDNTWLGAGVIVCPGVTVGADSVIGAGSVVTRDIPARTLAVGSPARPVREL